jgi:hypothetical protein
MFLENRPDNLLFQYGNRISVYIYILSARILKTFFYFLLLIFNRDVIVNLCVYSTNQYVSYTWEVLIARLNKMNLNLMMLCSTDLMTCSADRLDEAY